VSLMRRAHRKGQWLHDHPRERADRVAALASAPRGGGSRALRAMQLKVELARWRDLATSAITSIEFSRAVARVAALIVSGGGSLTVQVARGSFGSTSIAGVARD